MNEVAAWFIFIVIIIVGIIICSVISSANEAYKNKQVWNYENDPIRRDLYYDKNGNKFRS